MNLPALLVELKPLLADPEPNWDRIRTLLEASKHYAEYEVARHVVSPKLRPVIDRWLASEVPSDRVRALDMAQLVLTRSSASQVARRWIKDPNSTVRSRALTVASALGGREVALPNTRSVPQRDFRTRKEIPPVWGLAGWSFGLDADGARRYFKRVVPKELAAARKGLPELGTMADVAKLLGLDDAKDLKKYMRPGAISGSPYVRFEIPKASGGSRAITAPRASLKKIQRTLLREVFEKLPVHDAAHGFVRGRSITTNAKPHEGAALVLKLDLEDFFPTIHFRRVKGLLQWHGMGAGAATAIAGLVTYRGLTAQGEVLWPGLLPQGAPTSPAIANLVCTRLDARLQGLAKRCGGTYTRYADDLTFSFAVPSADALNVGRFFWWVDQICQQEGFGQNVGKRRVLRPSNQQRVTGVVVNTTLHVPRDARRRFRAVLHNCKKNGIDAEARGRADFRQYLLGFASFVKMVQPDEGAKLLTEVKELLKGEAPKSAKTPAPT